MMKYKGYLGEVELDTDAVILHGEVIGIRDVVTFQSKSVEGIEKAFRESVDDYLAFCRQRGEEPNKPYSGKFLVRVDSDLHRQLAMLARLSNKSLNTVIAEFLTKDVDAALPKTRTTAKCLRKDRRVRKTVTAR